MRKGWLRRFCAGWIFLRFDIGCAIVKSGHGHAGLKALYMAEYGIKSLRTAQHHAKHGHQDWVAFLARSAGSALTAKNPTLPQATALVQHMEGVEKKPGVPRERQAPPAMAKPEHQRSPEEYAECEAWECLVLANEQRNLALERGNPMEAVGYVKIASDASKAYFLARDHRQRAQIQTGRLKPIASWVAAKTAMKKAFHPVETIDSIAPAANPDNPALARKAIQDWKINVLGPAVERAIAEIERELAA